MSAYRLAPAARDLVTAYVNDLWDIGQRPDHKVLWGVIAFVMIAAALGALAFLL